MPLYEISTTQRFEAESAEEVVERMVMWLHECAGHAFYRVTPVRGGPARVIDAKEVMKQQ